MKTGHAITSTKRVAMTTSISAEDHLRNDVLRANSSQETDKLNTLVDLCVKLHKHKHSNKMEKEEDDKVTNTYTSMPHIMQPPRCMNLENSESGRQNSNRIKDMGKCSKQTQTEKM